MTKTALDLAGLKAHIGRRVVSTDVVSAAPASLLSLTFGRSGPELAPGDALPPGWHIFYFLLRFRPTRSILMAVRVMRELSRPCPCRGTCSPASA